MEPFEADKEGHHSQADKNQCRMKACLTVLVFIIVILVSLVIWMGNELKNKQQDCLTAECVDVSAYILNKMNQSADPCMDFYSYACGGWEEKNLIPPDKAKYDTFAETNTNNQDVIRQLLEENNTVYKDRNSSAVAKLKIYYGACMDVETIEADGTRVILEKIQELGSWSIAPDNQTGSKNASAAWDLVSSLIAFHKLGQASLFSFHLAVDSKNSSRYVFAFEQAGLTLASREEYLQTTDKFKNAFLSFAVKTGKLLGGDNSTYQKMEAIYNFEEQMAKIFVDKLDLVDPVKSYNLMTVAKFQDIVGSQMDVKRLMSGIRGKAVGDSEEVDVSTVDYFRKLGPLLASTDPQVIQDYLIWHMVQQLPGYLPQAFTDAAMILDKVEKGVTSVAPRWQRCVYKAEAAFGFVSSALYVEKTFPPESKQQALKILTEVQAAFIENVDKLSWMDQVTKDRAKTKAKAMHKAVAYPDWMLNPQRLDDYYEKAEVKEGEFLNNYFAMAQYEMQRMWDKQEKMPDKDDWSNKPDEVNAFFSSIFNQIFIQVGLLQRPYFDRHFPMSFAYGAMGMISGHELTHGFDNAGRKFDEKGNLNDWWSASSSREFQKKSQCLVDQYSAFTLDGTHLNGNYTLGENIADNGGLKLGYAAYLTARTQGEWEEPRLPALNLLPQQLFFLGFAQIWCAHYTPEYVQQSILTDAHSISKFRVEGAVANMPEFAEAFNCPAATPLNPLHRCEVW